ncbi:hypothetical protein [Tenacibaculum sp. 190524A02b]|uniref:hypothetical protein n=1 Tax=Tenacibaculum vairaonense TaxID=3137860 RepID=UPI0031FB544A
MKTIKSEKKQVSNSKEVNVKRAIDFIIDIFNEDLKKYKVRVSVFRYSHYNNLEITFKRYMTLEGSASEEISLRLDDSTHNYKNMRRRILKFFNTSWFRELLVELPPKNSDSFLEILIR